ncbi:MAG: XdhC family protein, partial [Parafannyhessea umbonata]|uniref:XdhC family protein n=1 Tax=Parafannyhessea umbonata TaxID=604330 RepID=UPI0026ECDC7F
LLEDLLGRLEAGERFVLREDWSEPASVVVDLLDASALAAGSAEARALAGQAATWDEASRTYVEPAGPDPVCYVFGGGHVGRALTGVLAHVGFRVVVADDRPGVAVPADFPAAERVVCGDLRNLAGMGIRVGGADYVVVTTHGHAWDIDVLQQVASARPAYVGCIGSRGKAAFARKTLRERGVDAAWLDSVHLPIGEDILAVTPAEIAISIAAQMIRCRAELRPPEQRPHADSSRAQEKN